MTRNEIRDVRLGTLHCTLEQRADGSAIVRSAETLKAEFHTLTSRLKHWAAVAPERTFLAQRNEAGAWTRLTYGEALAKVRSIARSLIERELSPERPVAILSGNGIDHALLGLGAMYVGLPFSPISPAYSLISSDHAKLKAILGQLTPGLVYASHGLPFGKAINAACGRDIEVVTSVGAVPVRQTTAFETLLGRTYDPIVEEIHAKITPERIAKVLFTSGSTGNPKGVINTHGMLSANQEMLRHWLAFTQDEPPVLVDWLPWNHTFGGNHNFGLVLYNGGTLYIDDGKPTPKGIEETICNLREVAPTVYFNVPKGFEEIVARLRTDTELRERFFSRLRLTFYAGASLAPHVAKELDELAIATTGKRILMVTSLGSTETAPAALACTREIAKPGIVGVPLPGVELKLVPSADKLEARLKGPTMMPGYWRDAEQTAKAFDEEGFYKLGDALKFAIPGDPQAGFVFDGRVSEDFKLGSGTWVSVGPLRARTISAFAPLVKDVVIAGHDRDDVTALIFPDMDGCRALLPEGSRGKPDAEVLGKVAVRAAFQLRLNELAGASTGSSTRVTRIILLDELPSIDLNEITDKGSINQRAVLSRRAALVDELYAKTPTRRVIAVG